MPTPAFEPRLTKNRKNREYDSSQANNFQGARGAADQRLFGDTVVWEGHRIKEKPVHVTMAAMAAVGYDCAEIAKVTGYNQHSVAKILRAPFARGRVLEMATRTVQDEIKAILEQEAVPSIRALVAVRDDLGARNSDKVSAANALLDRFLGKPTQPITTDAKPMADRSDAELMEEVRKEMAATQPN